MFCSPQIIKNEKKERVEERKKGRETRRDSLEEEEEKKNQWSRLVYRESEKEGGEHERERGKGRRKGRRRPGSRKRTYGKEKINHTRRAMHMQGLNISKSVLALRSGAAAAALKGRADGQQTTTKTKTSSLLRSCGSVCCRFLPSFCSHCT